MDTFVNDGAPCLRWVPFLLPGRKIKRQDKDQTWNILLKISFKIHLTGRAGAYKVIWDHMWQRHSVRLLSTRRFWAQLWSSANTLETPGAATHLLWGLGLISQCAGPRFPHIRWYSHHVVRQQTLECLAQDLAFPKPSTNYNCWNAFSLSLSLISLH